MIIIKETNKLNPVRDYFEVKNNIVNFYIGRGKEIVVFPFSFFLFPQRYEDTFSLTSSVFLLYDTTM